VRARQVEHDVPRLVEPTGRVALDLARRPRVAVPRLPHERGVLGVDTHPEHPAGEAQRHGTTRGCVVEAEEQHVVVGGWRPEDRDLVAEAELVVAAGRLLVTVSGEDVRQSPWRHDEVLRRCEDQGLLLIGPRCGDLRAGGEDDVLLLRCGEPGGDLDACGGRGEEGDTQQVEERDVQLVRHAVEPVEQLVDHEGEGLDERDPGVGDVVVGPLRTALLDHPLGIVDEVLEAAVVQARDGQAHRAASSSRSWGGIT
jgi:hypothetical protein